MTQFQPSFSRGTDGSLLTPEYFSWLEGSKSSHLHHCIDSWCEMFLLKRCVHLFTNIVLYFMDKHLHFGLIQKSCVFYRCSFACFQCLVTIFDFEWIIGNQTILHFFFPDKKDKFWISFYHQHFFSNFIHVWASDSLIFIHFFVLFFPSHFLSSLAVFVGIPPRSSSLTFKAALE